MPQPDSIIVAMVPADPLEKEGYNPLHVAPNMIVNPEPSRGISRAVGSLARDTGRYQHLACTTTEIFSKGDILVLCTNPKCPNKGANWALQEKLT